MTRWLKRADAVAFATALTTSALAVDDRVYGEWTTPSRSARIAIARCPDDPALVCGRVAWLAERPSADGTPVIDAMNPDPTLRRRPLLGLDVIRGLRSAGPDLWKGGTIYDPKTGRTYDGRIRLSRPDLLEVKACILLFCEIQLWQRSN